MRRFSQCIVVTPTHIAPRRDLMGVCSPNAPANCAQSPAWSVNGAFLTGVHPDVYGSDVLIDPLFMMHHGVRGNKIEQAGFLTYLVPQMIDRLWYTWQHADPANYWSFGGGSVSVSTNFLANRTFPTGIPPYMNVRGLLTGFCSVNGSSPSSRRRSRQMRF